VSHPPPGNIPFADEPFDQIRHDVNNALTVIRGYAHSLQRRLQRPDVLAAHELPDVLAQLAAIDAAVSGVVTAMERLDEAAAAPQETGDAA
jgi:DNA-binding FrmR family transcriptional regulator